jgi:LexA-binding, inner membrane-associated putative hydrolase
MFIGHIALALAAKRAAPRASLATLFLAAQWADVLWPIFLALGIEEVRILPNGRPFLQLDFISYPYSHSLLALAIWGLLFGIVYRAVAGGRHTLWILAGLVVSHWVLDWVTHVPDMPLYPGSAKYGLGLWNSVPGTIAIEGAMYVVGLIVYLRATRARDRIGRWAFFALAATLVVIYVASTFGPPPPSIRALWMTAISGAALLTLWAWWADRHRDVGN